MNGQLRRTSAIPLLLCYVAFPLSNQLAEAVGKPLYRNWIDVAWLVLVASTFVLRQRRGGVSAVRLGFPWRYAALCFFAIALALAGAGAGMAPLATTAMELKPVLYTLLTIVLISRALPPRPVDFCRYGAMLAALIVIEMLVRSISTATIERPIGSGEVNYDAALLCTSLVFASADRHLSRRYGWIIWIGILASFSRTSLFAACAVVLLSSAISIKSRVVMCSLAFGAVLMSFAIRDLEVGNVESLDRYWMWATGLDFISSNPLTSVVNAVPGRAVEADVPIFIAELWTDQQESLGLTGIYPFHFHAMWLRLAIAWGWLPVALISLLFFRHFAWNRHRAPEARPFFFVCLILGLTMGLLYLGNVAPIVFLAGSRMLLLHRHRHRPASRRVQPHAKQVALGKPVGTLPTAP